MNSTDDSSILAEPETTFEMDSADVKAAVDQLVEEGTPEAHDEIVQIAQDHGVPATPEMDDEEIKNRIESVI